MRERKRERGERERERKGHALKVTTLLLPLVNLPNAYIMARQTFLSLFLFPLASFFFRHFFLSNKQKRKQEQMTFQKFNSYLTSLIAETWHSERFRIAVKFAPKCGSTFQRVYSVRKL